MVVLSVERMKVILSFGIYRVNISPKIKCGSVFSKHCLQNGSLPVLKDFSGRGGDQSGHLEILWGTSRDTLTFSENIYLPADT